MRLRLLRLRPRQLQLVDRRLLPPLRRLPRLLHAERLRHDLRRMRPYQQRPEHSFEESPRRVRRVLGILHRGVRLRFRGIVCGRWKDDVHWDGKLLFDGGGERFVLAVSVRVLRDVRDHRRRHPRRAVSNDRLPRLLHHARGLRLPRRGPQHMVAPGIPLGAQPLPPLGFWHGRFRGELRGAPDGGDDGTHRHEDPRAEGGEVLRPEGEAAGGWTEGDARTLAGAAVFGDLHTLVWLVRVQHRFHNLPHPRRSPPRGQPHGHQHYPLRRGRVCHDSFPVDHSCGALHGRGDVQSAIRHERMFKRIGSDNSWVLRRRELGQHHHRTSLRGALLGLLQVPHKEEDRRRGGRHPRPHDQWNLGLIVCRIVRRAEPDGEGVQDFRPRGLVLQLGTGIR
mmetsp:Transcript_7037/g.15303  ORF Transcript_7037/g.15303 Transcript_7037/m.15303 type:complete len:394 (+) Transcript_7037:512-1693(+)